MEFMVIHMDCFDHFMIGGDIGIFIIGSVSWKAKCYTVGRDSISDQILSRTRVNFFSGQSARTIASENIKQKSQ